MRPGNVIARDRGPGEVDDVHGLAAMLTRPLVDLPPLELVRSFVAVGRCMSITLAARELGVTQSAVSRQIRALEQHLRCALFIRGHRSIELTSEGRRLLRIADPWLEQLGEAIAALRPPEGRPAVTITASVGVSSLWLLPRIGAFQAAHPGVELRVVASNRVIDLEHERIDLAIRYTPDAESPAGGIRLFGEELVPVAHGALGVAAIEDRDERRRHVLLELDDPSHPRLQWADWLKAMDAARVKPASMVRFNQYDQVVQAALAGQGVALGRLALVHPMLSSGGLALASRRAPRCIAYSYWMVPRSQAVSERAGVVQRWILREAADSPTAAARPGSARKPQT